MKATRIRVRGRRKHRKSGRVAVITWIVYPHFVEYKYERPTRYGGDPYRGHPGTVPYTRRMRLSYGRFITNFEAPVSTMNCDRDRDPQLVALREREGTCVCSGLFSRDRGCDCGWFMDPDPEPAPTRVNCPCYGCAIARQRAGVPEPDRSAEPCDPPEACVRDGRCWTHSTWTDEKSAKV